MPTQLNRAALLAAIDTVDAADRAAWERKWERYRDAVAKREQSWRDAYADAWADAAKQIAAAVRNGKVVTRSMIPDSSGGPRYLEALYSPDASPRDERGNIVDRPRDEFRPNAQTTSLRYALQAITDEQVTPNALQNLGITRDALRAAVQALGQSAVQ